MPNPALKACLFAAFGLAILWNKAGGQATITTLAALPGILDPDQPGYHDTCNPAPACPASVGQLTRPAIADLNVHGRLIGVPPRRPGQPA